MKPTRATIRALDRTEARMRRRWYGRIAAAVNEAGEPMRSLVLWLRELDEAEV